jgi:hypothetical protein
LVSRSAAAVVSFAPALLLAVNGCGVNRLPAPQIPEKVMPQLAMEAEPPEADEGTVVIDTTNGPATVVVSLWGSTLATHPICATTPCAANLPYGTYTLIFRGRNDPAQESSEIVQVGHAPSVFRHTMGTTRASYGLYTGGFLTLVMGALVAGFGLLGLADSSGFVSKNTAYVATGIGAAATIGGGLMMYYGRPEITPGSSIQWAPGGPAPPPASPGDKRQVLRLTPTGLLVTFN